MKNKMIEKIKKFILGGIILYVLNKFILPLTSVLVHDANFLNNPRVPQIMGREEQVYFYEGSDEGTALKYLKLAHAVTMKYLDSGNPDPSLLPTDVALEKRVGDCSESSRFTYSNYLFLVACSNKPELREYVRLATGTMVDGPNDGHAWLEIKRSGIWTPYETTLEDLPSSTIIDPHSIDQLIKTDNVLQNPADYLRTNAHQIGIDSEVKHTIEIRNIIQSRGFINQVVARLR